MNQRYTTYPPPAVIASMVLEQKDDLDDHDKRIKQLELRFAKWAGAFAALAFVGSLAGAFVGNHF